MADEMKFTGTISVTDTNYNEVINPGQISIDLGSLASEGGSQSTSTSASALNVANLSTAQDGGVAYFRNLDDTDTIEIGETISSTFYPWMRLKPGEAWFLRLSSRYPTNALQVKASANNPILQYRIFAGDV